MNTILNLEFAVQFTIDQQQLIDRWLQASRLVYNRGLAELEEWDRNHGYYVRKAHSDRVNEEGEQKPYYAPVCQLPWKLYRDESGNNVPYTQILSDSARWYVRDAKRVRIPTPAESKDSWGWEIQGASGYSCPIHVDYREPLLRVWQLQAAGGLGQVAKADYWNNQAVLEMPYKFRAGVLTMLETPWQEYLKSRMGKTAGQKRGKPKPKRSSDKIDVLIHPNPKGSIIHDGKDWLRGIPGLGRVRVPGLKRRWRNPDGSFPEIAQFKILRLPDGYRIQLTGQLDRQYRVKPSNQAVGIDPGLVQEFTLSTGEQIPPKRFYQASQKQRSRVQRSIAHKLTHNLILWLNHLDRVAEDIQDLIPVSAADAKLLMQCKSETEIVEVIGSARLNRLKHGIPASNRLKQLQTRAKKLERKAGAQRKAEDEKLTSRIVRNYGAIAVEDGLQSHNLRKAAAAKKDRNGHYTHNGATAQSERAKALADASPGRKIALLERKAKRSDREFYRVDSPYTTIACPVCAPAKKFQDWVEAKSYEFDLGGDRLYRCQCGWNIDVDIHSSSLIELISFGCDLSKQLSVNADRARRLSCCYSLAQPKGWMPYWAAGTTVTRWLGIRDAIMATVPQELRRSTIKKIPNTGSRSRKTVTESAASKTPNVLQ